MLRGFGMSGLGLDNPCDGVNQFLVSPGDGEKTASGEHCLGADRRGKPDTGARTRDAEAPKTRPVAELQAERGVNGRAGMVAGKRIGSSGRTRTYNPSVNSRMLYH